MTSPTSHPNPLLARGIGSDVPRPTPYYRFNRLLMRGIAPALWRIRVFGRRHEPPRGGAVYIANHQSFLDPMLVGFALTRPLNYMARDSLFRVPGLGWWIRSVNAFPVKRGKADTGAIKEAMRRLKQGRQVVVYAEGTRTRDGRVGPFLPGVAVLAQRSADWAIPVTIEGAFDVWPRTQLLPWGGQIVVRYGRAIPRAQARAQSAQAFVDRVRDEIIAAQADLRRRLGKPPLRYP